MSYDWCKAGYHLVHPDDDYWCQVSCDWRSTMLSSDWSAGAEVAEAAPEHSLLILRVGGDLGPGGHTSKVGDIRYKMANCHILTFQTSHSS